MPRDPNCATSAKLPNLADELVAPFHLNEHVAQLLAHMGQIVTVDCLEQFAAFVDQAAGEALMRLLLVPRAPVPPPHPLDSEPGGAGD